MAKTKQKPAATGTYVYDRELGRMVQVSEQVPGLKKGRSPQPSAGPCGKSACGGGRCS